jgi:hypothetical protein
MMTEATAAAGPFLKSKSICAAFRSLGFGEPVRASEFILAVTLPS